MHFTGKSGFLVFLASMSILGCNPTLDDKTKPDAQIMEEVPQVQITSYNLKDFVKVKVEPAAEPEKYMVLFSWPKFESEKLLRIRLNNTLAVVKSDQTDFNHEVAHNQLLNYSFEVLGEASKVQTSFTKQVQIPRDFVVKEGQSAFNENQNLVVNRLFISSAVPLVTNGFKISITTNELRSDGGVIETFPDGLQAPNDTEGKTPEEISITANLATGKLLLIMRGQQGGNGSQGAPYTDLPPGKDAEPGLDSYCNPNINSIVPKVFLLGGVGGGGGTGPQNPQASRPLRYCGCDRVGANAEDGKPGQVGRRGNNASPGGGTGNFRISIINASDFDFQYSMIPGAPGNPGPGGVGQQGGAGGKAVGGKCGGAAGTSYPRAANGADGDRSVSGKTGVACVYFSSENRNECH